MLGAAAAAIDPGGRDRAGEGEPVDARGAGSSGAPASAPMPCTTLNTPAGRPASWAMSASSEAVSGAHSGGLTTTVLPAASAGPIRQVASISGAFHGVMIATTPGRVAA